MIEKHKKRLSEGENCVKGVGGPKVGEEKAYCGLVASNVRRLDSTQTFTTPRLRRLNILSSRIQRPHQPTLHWVTLLNLTRMTED